MVADFDPAVLAIASQPFGLTGLLGKAERKHVPDYLLVGSDGVPTVVDVKLAEFAARPEVADVLGWTGRVLHAFGWRYEVWTGMPATRRENLAFLAQGRRTSQVADEVVGHLLGQDAHARTVGAVMREATQSGPLCPHHLRAGLVTLLWRQAWRVDLDLPPSDASLVTVPGIGAS